MSESTENTFSSSQEILFTQESLNELEDDFQPDFQPSTQEINNIHTQEASNASDFFDNLRESQISHISDSNDNQIRSNESSDLTIDYISTNESIVQKKKRGRKRKIRTDEEMAQHLREKKEKNRLAAQRLRQKKGTEIAKNDREVIQLEANVRAKRQFADLLESTISQLQNKIKKKFGITMKSSFDESIESNAIKIESNGNNYLLTNNNNLVEISDNLKGINAQQNTNQNRSQKQNIKKLEVSNGSDHRYYVSG